jgi:hypothetical protein
LPVSIVPLHRSMGTAVMPNSLVQDRAYRDLADDLLSVEDILTRAFSRSRTPSKQDRLLAAIAAVSEAWSLLRDLREH